MSPTKTKRVKRGKKSSAKASEKTAPKRRKNSTAKPTSKKAKASKSTATKKAKPSKKKVTKVAKSRPAVVGRGKATLNTDLLVGLTEISDKAEVSRSAVGNWVTRYEDFPEPVVTLASGPVFYWPEVKKWLRETRRI